MTRRLARRRRSTFPRAFLHSISKDDLRSAEAAIGRFLGHYIRQRVAVNASRAGEDQPPAPNLRAASHTSLGPRRFVSSVYSWAAAAGLPLDCADKLKTTSTGWAVPNARASSDDEVTVPRTNSKLGRPRNGPSPPHWWRKSCRIRRPALLARAVVAPTRTQCSLLRELGKPIQDFVFALFGCILFKMTLAYGTAASNPG